MGLKKAGLHVLPTTHPLVCQPETVINSLEGIQRPLAPSKILFKREPHCSIFNDPSQSTWVRLLSPSRRLAPLRNLGPHSYDMSAFQYTIPARDVRDRTVSAYLTSTWANICNRIGPLGLVNYLQHSRPPPQLHGFTSKAFVANGVEQPIPAPCFSTVFQSWRLTSLLQLCETCLWSICLLYMLYGLWSTILVLELVLVLSSLLLQKYITIKEPWSLRRIYRFLKDHQVSFKFLEQLIIASAPNH